MAEPNESAAGSPLLSPTATGIELDDDDDTLEDIEDSDLDESGEEVASVPGEDGVLGAPIPPAI